MKLKYLGALAALLFANLAPLQPLAAKHLRKPAAQSNSLNSCAAAWQGRVLPVVEKSYDDLFGSDDDEHDDDIGVIRAKFIVYCQGHGTSSAVDYFRRSYQ